MTVRLAWDGQYYTKTDFLLWYGRERGLDLWDEAGASFATPGGCIRSQMLIANSEPQEVEKIIISFILISGEKACKDLVVIRGPCTSAKHLRDHLRMHSSEDDVRILEGGRRITASLFWKSKRFGGSSLANAAGKRCRGLTMGRERR